MTLAQAVTQTQRTDRRSQVQVPASARKRCCCRHWRWGDDFRFFFVERSVTAAAEIVDGTELNEQAVVATDNFPGIYRGKSCGHLGLGVARAEALRGAGGQAPNLKVIWSIEPVDVKGFLGRNRKQTPSKPKRHGENQEKTGKKT